MRYFLRSVCNDQLDVACRQSNCPPTEVMISAVLLQQFGNSLLKCLGDSSLSPDVFRNFYLLAINSRDAIARYGLCDCWTVCFYSVSGAEEWRF